MSVGDDDSGPNEMSDLDLECGSPHLDVEFFSAFTRLEELCGRARAALQLR